MMRVGILGTGNLAQALAEAWSRAGHQIVVTGRSQEKAEAISSKVGSSVSAAEPREFATKCDAVVVAVSWEGLDEALDLVGAQTGALSELPVIDCTNPIDWATGASKVSTGSAVEHVAQLSKDAHVVKALHLYAGQGWLMPNPTDAPRVVAMCGDNQDALEVAGTLVKDLGGIPVTLGGLECGRQLEEVAGFVTRLARAGINPVTAVPFVAFQ